MEAEIEITDEMTRAGSRAIGLYESGDHELAAYSCFRAMVLASPQYIQCLRESGFLKLPAQ